MGVMPLSTDDGRLVWSTDPRPLNVKMEIDNLRGLIDALVKRVTALEGVAKAGGKRKASTSAAATPAPKKPKKEDKDKDANAAGRGKADDKGKGKGKAPAK